MQEVYSQKMKLSTKSRYAIMAMVDVAYYAVGKPITAHQVAQRQNIATNYLEQIFLKLKRAELVKSVKGPGGGYLLTRNVKDIYISEILLAMDNDFNLTRCGAKSKSNSCMSSGTKCLTHHLWDDLGKHILNHLKSVSLADVMSKSLKNSNMESIQASPVNMVI
ncbi:MAG: Rrf2 family transcriptional regulator [Alphaproteobacteria bacterium]